VITTHRTMQNSEDNDTVGSSNNKLSTTADLLINRELMNLFLIVFDNERDQAN